MSLNLIGLESLYEEEETQELVLFPCTRRDGAMWGHSKKVAIYKPGREASPETKPANTLILHLWLLELLENEFCFLDYQVAFDKASVLFS